MKYFVSDIHGCLPALKAGLRKVKFKSKQDTLIVLGDICDRGPHTKEVIDFLIQLPSCHFVLGNHDAWFLEFLDGTISEKTFSHWLSQGGRNTLLSYLPDHDPFRFTRLEDYRKRINSQYPLHRSFLQNALPFYEDEQIIGVHAGIDLEITDWRNSDSEILRWDRELPSKRNTTGKTIIFGHTPTNELHKNHDIYYSPCKTIIGIDGGYVYEGKLHIFPEPK